MLLVVKSELALLSLLKDRDMYGVEMVNRILIKPSTVYSALKTLERKKYANTYERESKIGGRRRFYSVTGAGRSYYEENKNKIDFQVINVPAKIKKRTAQSNEDAYHDDAGSVYTQNDGGIFILPLSKDEQYRVNITPEVAQAIDEQAPDAAPPELPLFEIKNEEPEVEPEEEFKEEQIIPEPEPEPEPEYIPEPEVEPEPKIEQEIIPEPEQIQIPEPIPQADTTPYITPQEKILYTKPQPQQISIDISGTKSPDINPLPKLNSNAAHHGFVLYNKLKFFSNFLATAIVIIISSIFIIFIPTSPADVELTILCFVLSGIYFSINMLVWFIFPRTKRNIAPKFAKSLAIKRTIASGVLLLIVLSLYLIVNAHLENTDVTALYWGLVFGIVSLTPAIESVLILSFKKIKMFMC